MTLTTAERRAYQQLCGKDGMMLVIAADQRGSMRKLLASAPEDQAKITDGQLGEIKASIVKHLAADAPCVLLDPTCAVPRVVDDGVLPRDVALLIAIDATGHGMTPEGFYVSRLEPGLSARRVRALGGTAGKLLVYLRSDHPAAMAPNLDLMRKANADFAAEDMLLVVEFLPYRLPDEDPAAYAAKLPELIAGNARLCLEAGSKVLKLPYPGSAEACRTVSAIAKGTPWAVLSAGVDHKTFLGQVEIAVANGACGVIAGRSLWKDCIALDPATTARLLTERGQPRLREMKDTLARLSGRAR